MVQESSGGREAKGMRVQLLAKVRRQAARAVQSLLKGDADRRASASIRSLIYAPSIVAKKATLALTCQTLKCEFLLLKRLSRAFDCNTLLRLVLLLIQLRFGMNEWKSNPPRVSRLAFTSTFVT